LGGGAGGQLLADFRCGGGASWNLTPATSE
jgi:hypothetical protein